MSAIYLAKNQIYNARMKHIDVKFHFIGEILDEDNSELKKTRTKENPVDMLTGSEVWALQEFTPYPSSCLSSVELVWINYRWLHPSGREYVGHHIVAASWVDMV